MAAFEHVSSVCTLTVLRGGALAGAASRGRENIRSGSVNAERIGWSSWVAWPMGPGVLGRQGDTGTAPGLGGLSKLSAVPKLLGREHRATVDGREPVDRARAGCCPIYTIGR